MNIENARRARPEICPATGQKRLRAHFRDAFGPCRIPAGRKQRQGEMGSLPEWHRDILNARVEEHEAEPDAAIPWHQAEAELRKGLAPRG